MDEGQGENGRAGEGEREEVSLSTTIVSSGARAVGASGTEGADMLFGYGPVDVAHDGHGSTNADCVVSVDGDVRLADIPEEDHLLPLQAGTTVNIGHDPVAQTDRSGDEAGGYLLVASVVDGSSRAGSRLGAGVRSRVGGQARVTSPAETRGRRGAGGGARGPRGRSAPESLQAEVSDGWVGEERARVQLTSQTLRSVSAARVSG